MDPSALLVLARRIRWRNVARVGAVAALGLLVLAWPRLSSAPVAVPAAGAVPVVRGPVGRVLVAPAPAPTPRPLPSAPAARRRPAPRPAPRTPPRRPAKTTRPARHRLAAAPPPRTPSISTDHGQGKRTGSPRAAPAPASRPTATATATATAPTRPVAPAPAPRATRQFHPTREFGPARGDF